MPEETEKSKKAVLGRTTELSEYLLCAGPCAALFNPDQLACKLETSRFTGGKAVA